MTEEPKHEKGCIDWCNHCEVCGTGIVWGSRCREHYLTAPDNEGNM